MTRCIVYARHSTEAQAGSVQQQLTAARAYAGAHGYEIAATFQDEAKSGKSAAGRDGLAAFLAFVAKRPRAADVVLLWDASRLSRDQDDAAIMRAQLRKAGYRVEYVGDQSINVGGKEQRIVEALADYRADIYRDDLSRNVKRGMAATLAAGGAWGRPPKGFDVERDADDTPRLVPNADLPRVIEAFRLRAAGYSISYIHRETGICRTSTGYRIMLNNQIYLGRLEWGGVVYQVLPEPVVTPEIFSAVQSVNARTVHPRRVSSSYLLSGAIYCARCGLPMNGSRMDKRGKEYKYYRCRNNLDTGPSCHLVRAEFVEDKVIAELLAYFEPARFRRVYAEWRRRRTADSRDGTGRAERLRENLAKVDAAITRLTTAIERGGKLDSLLVTLQAREAERAGLQDQLAAPIAKAPPPVDIIPLCDSIRARLQAGDEQARRLAVRALVERVTYASPESIAVSVIPLDKLFGL